MHSCTSLISLLHYFKIYCLINIKITCQEGFQVVLMVRNQPANTGDIWDTGSIPGSGRSPGGGYGNPLQYDFLGNPRHREAWQATVHWISRVRHDWSDLVLMHAICQDEPWSSKTFYSQSGLGTSSIGKELVRDAESQSLKYSSKPLDEDLHFKKKSPGDPVKKSLSLTDEFRIGKQSFLKEKSGDRSTGDMLTAIASFSRACLLRNGNPWRVFYSMLFIGWHSLIKDTPS